MLRDENTIYIRCTSGRWQAFGKAKGEGFIVAFAEPNNTEKDVVEGAGDILWAINKFGPEDYHNHKPFDEIPGKPSSHNYPVVKE